MQLRETARANGTGYADPDYAASLHELGTPRLLPRSGGHLLVRPIPGTGYVDGIGPYPIFSCSDWSGLKVDLEELGDELVSVSLVADPFGNWTTSSLQEAFPDRMIGFKEHFVVDLSRPPLAGASKHHRRNVARATRDLVIELSADPSALLDEWCSLYENLVRRNGITGVTAFSRESFARQLEMQGLVALRALRHGETVAATLWVLREGVAYYHLGASSQLGYDLRASFGLFALALENFAAAGLEWASLGAAAGLDSRPDDGLARFKRGWSSGTRTVYFCGRILSAARYRELSSTSTHSDSQYFPAYRRAEFA